MLGHRIPPAGIYGLFRLIYERRKRGNVETIFERMGISPPPCPDRHMVGTPGAIDFHMEAPQMFNDSCAIKAQEVIIERYTNRPLDERKLVEYATSQGWYTPGMGTPIQYTGKLIEEAGIPVSYRDGANVFDLYEKLGSGKQVIIGVDGSELRGNPPLWDFFQDTVLGMENADHAVIVAGINAQTGMVLITDPATGMTHEYTIERLNAAWADSGFFMMHTEIPAPKWVPGMESFNYSAGHIADIGGIPYSDFAVMSSEVATESLYTSAFDLTDFLRTIPLAYGELLSNWSRAVGESFPADWRSLCMPDSQWLNAFSTDFDGIPEPSEAGSFFDKASEIFSDITSI